MITNGLAILIGAVILAVYLIYAIIRKRPVKRIVVTCIFIIYLVAVAIVTLFPIVYDDVTEYTDTITWYNFIPFKTIVSAFQNGVTTTAITQIIGNIARLCCLAKNAYLTIFYSIVVNYDRINNFAIG